MFWKKKSNRELLDKLSTEDVIKELQHWLNCESNGECPAYKKDSFVLYFAFKTLEKLRRENLQLKEDTERLNTEGEVLLDHQKYKLGLELEGKNKEIENLEKEIKRLQKIQLKEEERTDALSEANAKIAGLEAQLEGKEEVIETLKEEKVREPIIVEPKVIAPQVITTDCSKKCK